MTSAKTFYWYDLETFGLDAARDRVAQFAGIRTDMDLNIIADPQIMYCKISPDVLPQPEACLVTGITPQKTLTDGIPEHEFIAAVHAQFAKPNTCVAGFNNIRFDDEFMRYALYRNFFDPYAREWQNGNSRWDIIDMVRITRALRPDGINWPVDENNIATNRLELITKANGIAHEAAHDAMSDVYATIAVARLIKQKQPRLYDFISTHRSKDKIAELLNIHQPTPVLHASDMFPGTVCNTAMVLPVAPHPTNKNGIIVYDLRYDPAALLTLTADEIRTRIYTPRQELAEGVDRIPVKTVHINKCPVVVPLNTLDEASADRLNIDRPLHLKHSLTLLDNIDTIRKKLREVFSDNPFPPTPDPDLSLYSGGFFSDTDRQRMQQIRATAADKLGDLKLNFNDARLDEMLFRYRARNFPQTLNPDEQANWQLYRQQRLTDKNGGGSITLDEYKLKITTLLADNSITSAKQKVLHQLMEYANGLSNPES
ncbi:MAG: exodeoxyribonuclease I [Gammaproteobacteria bacterium]|nr:exodeoxyribonuclease I [Gammaproteobacteria bacterium]